MKRILGIAKGSLRRRLFFSHLFIAFLGGLMLLVALATSWTLRRHLLSLTRVELPAFQSSSRLLHGIESSSAALRGWVFLGKQQFLTDHDRAWRQEIVPAMAELNELFKSREIAPYAKPWREIEALTAQLRDQEQRVAEIAHRPGNEPARQIFSSEISPLSARIFQAISTLVAEGQKQVEANFVGGQDVKKLQGHLAAFQGDFSFSQKYLSQFIDTGLRRDRRQFQKTLKTAEGHLDKLRQSKKNLLQKQAPLFTRLEDDFSAYQRAVSRALAIRASPQWNRARQAMSVEIAPLVQRMTILIGGLHEIRGQYLDDVSRQTLWISSASLAGMVFLIVAMVVVSVYYGLWHSRALTEPIESLAHTASEITRGRFTGDLPVRGDDEMARLTVAFNRMQASVRAEIEMKTRLEELMRSNTELDQFAAVASHDLQEPIRTIRNYVELLARKAQDHLPADAEKYIRVIVAATERMQAMIKALLAYAQVGGRGENFQRVDLAAIVEQVRANLAAKIDETGTGVCPVDLPAVQADPEQMALLLQNLIANGIKFRNTDSPQIRITADRGEREWVIGVADNGIGIDPKHREIIFQMFQRLHQRDAYPGVGIGLAICKKIVERHGGRIWVESRKGSGSTFYFSLPATAHETEENHEPQEAAHPAG